MYVSQAKLPHLLQPDDYTSESAHQRDLELLRRSWHLVGTTAELSRDGDFLTVQIAGIPIQIRNFRGTTASAFKCMCPSACADLFEAMWAICNDAMPIPRLGVSRGWTHGKIPEPEELRADRSRFVSSAGLQLRKRWAIGVRQS